MTKRFTVQFTKTYATEANAEKDIQKYLNTRNLENAPLTYIIMPTVVEGFPRFGVAFLGHSAIDHHVHFD